jgi:hypothetical protein
MKNIIKYSVSIIMVCLLVWCVWSWHNIITTNAPTNDREPSQYNLFVLLTQQDEEVDSERKDYAYIECVTKDSVLFCTTDGELWELRVAEPADWNISEDYVITFDTMETEEKEDDRIVAVSVLQELKSHG